MAIVIDTRQLVNRRRSCRWPRSYGKFKDNVLCLA